MTFETLLVILFERQGSVEGYWGTLSVPPAGLKAEYKSHVIQGGIC